MTLNTVAFPVCREKPVASPDLDIQCILLLYSSPQWSPQALLLLSGQGREGNSQLYLLLQLTPSLDSLVNLTRESRQLWVPSCRLTWAENKASDTVDPHFQLTSALKQLHCPQTDPHSKSNLLKDITTRHIQKSKLSSLVKNCYA